jgi:branched-chain amino acid aminotransferase
VTPGALWVDGRIVARDEPALRADDHGFLIGDGIFETFLVRGGRPLFWERHMARMARAFSATGITPVGAAELRSAVDDVLAAATLDDARLRLTVSSGPAPAGLRRGARPTVVADVSPLPSASGPLAPARVVTAPGARNERSSLAGVKSTSYGDAVTLSARAADVGADDVLLGDTRDRLSEALTANVFVVVGGRVLTPGLAAGCLPGIVRELVLEAGAAEEADIPLASLADAEEVFLSSSVAGVRPVGTIDGRPVPAVGGPATERARQAVAAAEAAELSRTSDPTP